MKLPELQTMSRGEAEAHVPRVSDAMISISSPGNTAAGFEGEAKLKDGYAAVLRLAFHDVPKTWPPTWPQMSDRDAQWVAEFVVESCLNNGSRPVDRILVHCDLGQSRSVSMAMAIHRVLHGGAMHEERPRNVPVYALTLQAFADLYARLRVN